MVKNKNKIKKILIILLIIIILIIGFSSSSYWSSPTLYEYDTGPMNASWIYTTANHTSSEWFLSPSSHYSSYMVALWNALWSVTENNTSNVRCGVRPVLNLLSTATIDANHEGTESDPYVILERCQQKMVDIFIFL